MRSVSTAERRARLGVRQHLAVSTNRVEVVAADLIGLHSSDPTTVYLSSWARVAGFAAADLEEALYERRSLVRMLGMRRTMFVVPRGVAATMGAACARALAPAERRRLIRMLEEQGITPDGSVWLEGVEAAVLDALDVRGEATAAELTTDVPELGRRLRFGEGKSWGGTVGVSTRVLFLLATEGRVIRGRPKGTWVSSQYRWAPTTQWLDGGIDEIDAAEARVELARRWLATFGPGTEADLAWWTGWGVRQTRSTLDQVGVVEVRIGPEIGYLLEDDVDSPAEPAPWVALLPSLDPTVMGWKQREWYLGDHQALLFDRNGNAGPTVWSNGRVVGGWGQGPDGEVVFLLLEDVGSEAFAAIAAKADELQHWLGDTRVTPRFRTPLDRQLAASGG